MPTSLYPLATCYDGYNTSLFYPTISHPIHLRLLTVLFAFDCRGGSLIGLLLTEGAFSYYRFYRFRPLLHGFDSQSPPEGNQFFSGSLRAFNPASGC